MSATMVGNTSGPCPSCGSMGTIPDGLYDVFGEFIRILALSSRSATSLERLASLLRSAQEQRLDSEATATAIENETPEFAELATNVRDRKRLVPLPVPDHPADGHRDHHRRAAIRWVDRATDRPTLPAIRSGSPGPDPFAPRGAAGDTSSSEGSQERSVPMRQRQAVSPLSWRTWAWGCLTGSCRTKATGTGCGGWQKEDALQTHGHIGPTKSIQGLSVAGGLCSRVRRCVLVRHQGDRFPRPRSVAGTSAQGPECVPEIVQPATTKSP